VAALSSGLQPAVWKGRAALQEVSCFAAVFSVESLTRALAGAWCRSLRPQQSLGSAAGRCLAAGWVVFFPEEI